jgi:hypothetical protein
MNMNRIQGLLSAVLVIFGLFALSDAAPAAATKQNHHNGKTLVAAKLKTDGHHVIDKKGHFTASVESKGGKIAAFHVRHDTRGDIPVKKYKTNKKMAAAGAHVVYASFHPVQDQDLGTVYIGYSYIDDEGNEEIYWFPEEMILDGDTGAVEYVPTSC